MKYGFEYYKEKYGAPRYDFLVIIWGFGICINFFFGFWYGLLTMFIYGLLVIPIVEQEWRRKQ
jgi:hypothetical protein